MNSDDDSSIGTWAVLWFVGVLLLIAAATSAIYSGFYWLKTGHYPDNGIPSVLCYLFQMCYGLDTSWIGVNNFVNSLSLTSALAISGVACIMAAGVGFFLTQKPSN